MNYTKYILIILIICSAYACKKNNISDPLKHTEFKNSIEINGEVVNLDRNILNNPSGMIIIDSLLVIDDPYKDNLLTLVDLKNKKVVKRFLKKGRGPEECIIIDLYKFNEKMFYAYGKSLHKILMYDIDSLNKQKQYKPKTLKLNDKGKFISALYVNNSICIGTGNFSNGRYGLLKNNKTFETKYSFPDDGTKYSYKEKSAAYGSELDINPDGDKFVSSINVGAVLEIFSIKNNKISKIKDLHYYYPKYKIINGGEGIGYGAQYYENKNKLGFTDVYTTNKSIFAKYSGKYLKMSPDLYTLSTGSHVLVYDWEGNPKEHYSLEYDVEYICIDENANSLYGITYTPEPKIIHFKLN